MIIEIIPSRIIDALMDLICTNTINDIRLEVGGSEVVKFDKIQSIQIIEPLDMLVECAYYDESGDFVYHTHKIKLSINTNVTLYHDTLFIKYVDLE